MKSYSFNPSEIPGSMYYKIWKEIHDNGLYFKKFNGNEADEAMQRALLHSLKHFDEEKGSLHVYIKSLAKTIAQSDGKSICVDFLEQTLEDQEDEPDCSVHQPKSQKEADFSNELVDNMYLSVNRTDEVIDLALSSMNMFLVLCKAIDIKDSSTVYYSDTFIRSCLSLSRKCVNFNKICLDIYREYGKDMEAFINPDPTDIGTWCEADYTFIGSRTSRRVTLIGDNGCQIDDADMEPFYVKGNYKGKKIVRVRYVEQYERLLDLIDSPVTNAIKFVINGRYIIKTLGGSVSVCNPNLYNIYDLVQDEILTNLLKDIKTSSILNVGSECMYFLCKSDYDLSIPERCIRGIHLKFEAEEVEI